MDTIDAIETKRAEMETNNSTPRHRQNRRRSASSPDPFRVSIDLFPQTISSDSLERKTFVVVEKPKHRHQRKNLSMSIQNLDERAATRRRSNTMSLSSLGVILCEEENESDGDDGTSNHSSQHSQQSFLQGCVDPINNNSMDL